MRDTFPGSRSSSSFSAMRVHYVGLRVANIDAAIAWYAAALDFRVMHVFSLGEHRFAYLVPPDRRYVVAKTRPKLTPLRVIIALARSWPSLVRLRHNPTLELCRLADVGMAATGPVPLDPKRTKRCALRG